MIEKWAWNIFEKTGNIDTYLEYKKYEKISNELKVKKDEDFKGEWDNTFRK